MAKLRSFDIFGKSFSFNISDETSKNKTKLGAILSLTCIVITIGGFYIFTSGYLDKTNPKTTISSQKTNTYPHVVMREHAFLPVFSFMSSTQALAYDQMARFITPVARKFEFKLTENGVEPNFGDKMQKMVDCRNANITNKDLIQELEDSGSKIFYDMGLLVCPENINDEDFWFVEGSSNFPPNYFISIMILPCSLPDPSECASLEELVNFEVRFSLAYNTYKLQDKDHPVERIFSPNHLNFPLNPRTYQIGQMYFRKIDIWNEDYDFFKANFIKEIFSISDLKIRSRYRDESKLYCDLTSGSPSDCVPYSHLEMLSGNEVLTVYRIYPKLFNMVSEVGGFSDLIFILVGFFYAFYNGYFYNQWVRNKSIWNDEKHLAIAQKKNGGRERLKEIREHYFDEKINGKSTLENYALLEGIAKSTLSCSYRRAIELIPLLERLEDKQDSTKDVEEKLRISPEQALEDVLASVPTNEIERLVQKKIQEYVSEKTFEAKVIDNGHFVSKLSNKKAIFGAKNKSLADFHQGVAPKISRGRSVNRFKFKGMSQKKVKRRLIN